MKKLIFVLVCGVLFLSCGCEEDQKVIRVVGITNAGDIKIDAGKSVTKKGLFEESKNYDIFDSNDMVIARILITQRFPDYSIGTLTTRLDGSGTRPNPKDIGEGMICKKTTKETVEAEKRIYKNQKIAFKRQYKLMKMRAKSGVFESVEKTVEDSNAIDSIDYTEVNGNTMESFGVKKK